MSCDLCAQKVKQLESQRDDLLAALCCLHATSTGLTHEQWLESMTMAEATIAKATEQ